MDKYSVFDILGPVMIGPSSSHTAGAARLGKIARGIVRGRIKKVDFYLHGSFAKTYKGHGTDRALVAGILGMEPWDERLKDSLQIAKEKGIEVEFHEIYLEDAHPNTVKFVIVSYDLTTTEIIGSSIGGGNIVVTEVNGQAMKFTGELPALIIRQDDIPGVISTITTMMYEKNINIANMNVYRNEEDKSAAMVFETDTIVPEDIINKIKGLGYIDSIMVINPMMEGEF